MPFTYQKVVARKAWSLFRQRSRDWDSQVMGFLFRTAILFAILFFVPWFGDVKAESRLAAAAVASVILSVGLSLIWDFIRAPEVIWQELSERLSKLEWAIQPKFSVLTNLGQKRDLNYGHVSRTANGKTTIILTQAPYNLLLLDVRNEAATTLKGCEAYLSNFWEVGGEDSVFQSMRLQWVPVGDESEAVDIPSSGHRTVIVFNLTGNRVSFVHDRVPFETQKLWKDDGHYCGIVALTAQNTPTAYVGFELICSEDSEPIFKLVRRGFEDAELIPWVKETVIGF